MLWLSRCVQGRTPIMWPLSGGGAPWITLKMPRKAPFSLGHRPTPDLGRQDQEKARSLEMSGPERPHPQGRGGEVG